MKPAIHVLLSGVAIAAACGGGPAAPREPDVPEPFSPAEVRRILRLSPVPGPPPDATNRWADDPEAAELGRALFYDTRLSKEGKTSCASCHDPARSWTDGRQLAVGVLELTRHSPSLWNAAQQRWLFWDGRADSLWAQALEPLENPLEQASSRLEIAHVIHADEQLRETYAAIFGPMPPLHEEQRFPARGRPVPGDDHSHLLAAEHERTARLRGGHTHQPGSHFYHPHQRAWDGMTREDQDAVTQVFVNVGKAIAAFERRIMTSEAPFDVFVEGLREGDPAKQAALDQDARQGLKLFLGKARCHICHDGPLFSDLEFHDIGLIPLDPERPDPGRARGVNELLVSDFNGVGRWSDEPTGEARFKVDFLPRHQHSTGEFKTPSLRNVAATAPYMHHGQLASLAEVIDFYADRKGARTQPPPRETILAPLELTQPERELLIHFLETLTDGAIPPSLLAPGSPGH